MVLLIVDVDGPLRPSPAARRSSNMISGAGVLSKRACFCQRPAALGASEANLYTSLGELVHKLRTLD